jgi:hypothetical protein
MDTDQLIAHSRARFEHESARRTLREKYQAKLTFAYGGGMWRAGPELNCTIFTCGRMGEVVLEDLYGNPVKANTTELMALSQERYNEQMNAWLVEHEELNRNR